ncbi:MAG TPA: vanadium-dependent haloperoxidase [Saprospiraceae bacterium]|nr:vanadium-dependent haloperoxidase [Saprospiraceae bacterium]
MKKLKFILLFVFLCLIIILSCKRENSHWMEKSDNPEFLHRSMKKLTDIIVYDIFSPPVASRNYVYPSVAAFEVMRHSDTNYLTLAGQLNGLDHTPDPDNEFIINYPLAATQAFLTTAKSFIFSEDKLNTFHDEIIQEFKDLKIPKDVFKRSIDFGNLVAHHILQWSKKDNYHQSRSFPKFSVTGENWKWKPTPPGYMDAIEPSWNKIRTFKLDSAQQFKPPFHSQFNLDPSSSFFKETMEVYHAVNESDDEQREIAAFWDCNPYVINVTGHVMHATKKITPGGHWMNIAGIASRKAGLNYLNSSAAYALTSITLADGFISCWDEKYRSSLIRPESVINEYIDEDWKPLLQTPPFPEYTSGHSVISSAAATVLTALFGDNFDYIDDTELEFGLPVRAFKSFYEAADEAAISRLYGGIHYRPAIDNGVIQGGKIGKWVIENITIESGKIMLGQLSQVAFEDQTLNTGN